MRYWPKSGFGFKIAAFKEFFFGDCGECFFFF